MLVLSRRKDESIVIPDLGLEFRVLGIEHGRVKLGFEAPSNVRIMRTELAGDRSKSRRKPQEQT